MTGREVVIVDGLSKRYGDRWAVDDVSFSIEAGETVALLGHNGAGKTTTVDLPARHRYGTRGELTG